MIETLRKNAAFVATLLAWTFIGMYAGPVIYIVLPINFFIYRNQGKYQELLLGFFYILILSDSRQYTLAWAESVKNILIVLLMIFMITDRNNFGNINGLYKKFIPFFAVAFLCLLFAPEDNLFVAFEKTISYLFMLIIIPTYLTKCYSEYKEEFCKALVYFGACILVAGLILKFLNHEQTYMEDRYRGILGNPNGLGIFCLLSFLVFYMIQDTFPQLFSRRERIVIYGLIALSLLMSGSRNSIFAGLIFLFFSYFARISTVLAIVMFVVMMTAYQYISDNIVYIVEGLGLSNYFRVSTLEDASGRFIAWNFAIENIKKSPWLGRGFEYTNYLYQEFAQYLNDLGHNGNAHNTYLTWWLDTGLVGLLAYLWAFFGSFIQAAKRTKLAVPLLFAIVFSTFFESWLTASLNPFTIQLLIILTILTSEEFFERKAPATLLVQ